MCAAARRHRKSRSDCLPYTTVSNITEVHEAAREFVDDRCVMLGV